MVTYQRKNLQHMTTSERLGYVRLEKCVRQVGGKTVREGVHIDSPRNLRCPSDGGELSQLRSGIARFEVQRTHYSDHQAYRPGFPLAEHPDTIREKELNGHGSYSPEEWSIPN